MAKSDIVIKIAVTDMKAFRIAYAALCEINAYPGENIVALERIASDALYKIQALVPDPGAPS